MAAQRFEDALISAIDIDQHAIDAATVNIEQSPWQDRISLNHGSVLTADFPQRFDAIICNPPYFNSENRRSKAKEPPPDTPTAWSLSACPALFRDNHWSRDCQFHPTDAWGEGFIKLAEQCGWYLAKRLDVKTTDKKPASRILFELSKDPACEQDLQRESLTIHHQSGYSEAFIALTKDFYLKM